MIPISLTLTNFMSYREAVTLDFENIRTACLSGKNGAGKSALLDAITWAVWGKTRSRSDREVISIGEEFMEVIYEFRIANREFQVFRRRTTGNRLTLHFYSRQVGSTDFGMVSGDSVRDTQQRIISTLKIDYDTFINSAFLMQGKADSFTQMRPGERKQILGEILNLGDYDDLARNARQRKNSAVTRLSTLQEQIEQADSRLKTRPATEQSLNELEVEQQLISQELQTNRQVLQSLKSQLQSFELLAESQKKTHQKHQNAGVARQKLQQRISESESVIATLESLLEREADIRQAAADFKKWRKISDECADLLRKRQPIEEKLSQAQRSIDQQANLLDRDIDRESERVKRNNKLLDEFADDSRKLAELESISASATKRITELITTIGEVESLADHRLQLQARNSKLADDAKDIKLAIDALRNGDATCPVCRRPLDEGDHQHIELEWERDLEMARELYRENTTQVNALNKKFEQVQAVRQSRDSLQSEENRRQAALEQIRKNFHRQPEIEQDLAVATRMLAELRETKSSKSFATAERALLAEAENTLENLHYDGRLHAESQKQLQLLRNAEHDLSELEQSHIKAENLNATITELQERLEALDYEIVEYERELTQYAEKLALGITVQQEHQKIDEKVEELEKRHATVQSGIGGARNQLAQLDDLADQRRQLKKSQAQLSLQADAYDELSTAFGINGIQAMVIENVLPELQDDANALLHRMSTSHLHVNFRTTRQAVTNDRVTETLDIIIRDEAGERPYDLYSGGEAFRVNFAIRIALSKLLARRAGATVDLLIIDEGFGTQDTQGRDGLVEALNSIQDYFEMILVITHIEDIRDQFDSRIDVVKTASGSQIILN